MLLEDFSSLPSTVLKKGHTWVQGWEQQATCEKVKILVKPVKALGVSQAELPFGLDMSVTPEVVGQAPWQIKQRERVPLWLWSQLWTMESKVIHEWAPAGLDVWKDIWVCPRGSPHCFLRPGSKGTDTRWQYRSWCSSSGMRPSTDPLIDTVGLGVYKGKRP